MDMVTGIVKENWNQDLPGCVRVEYRLGEEGQCLSGWMPVMTGYAGPGYGAFLRPEVGAEVVVGFLHGSGDSPFVAGCLQSYVNSLPEGAAAEENENKLLRTKAGWQIKVDEKARTLSFTDDQGENTFSLNSEEGTLSLNLKTKLELKIDGETFLTIEKGRLTAALDLEIDSQKLTVKAEKGLMLAGQSVEVSPDEEVTVKGNGVELSPSGNVAIKGQKIELKPAREVAISGMTTSIKPSQSFELKAMQGKIEGTALNLKGTASAKLEAGGMLELKGVIVKLN